VLPSAKGDTPSRNLNSQGKKPMADKTQKVPENVPGKWYVDDTCTPCHVCLDEAPKLLKYTEDESKVFFFKQPVTPEEEQAADAAMAICPTGAIGDDGE
jgi:ferredoxin